MIATNVVHLPRFCEGLLSASSGEFAMRYVPELRALIVRGRKTIEVREWQLSPGHLGPFLIHVSNMVDWKSMKALGYDSGRF